MDAIRRDIGATGMDLKTAGAQTLYDYWDGLRQGRLMPTVANFDLIEIATILPSVMVFTPVTDLDFKFRFFGTELVRGIEADLTGVSLRSVLDPDDAQKTIEAMRKVIAQPTALVRRYQVPSLEGGSFEAEHLLLPIADKNGAGHDIAVHAEFVGDPGEYKTFSADEFSPQKLFNAEWHPLAQ